MTKTSAQRRESPLPAKQPSDTDPASPTPTEEIDVDENRRSSPDTEGDSRPVRDKLKKTSIAGLPKDVEHTSEKMNGEHQTEESKNLKHTGASPRRLHRKRSSSDSLEDDYRVKVATEKPPPHVRKRSRDSSYEGSDVEAEFKPLPADISDDKVTHSQANPTVDTGRPSTPVTNIKEADKKTLEGLASPKNKRDLKDVDEADEPKAKRQRSESPESDLDSLSDYQDSVPGDGPGSPKKRNLDQFRADVKGSSSSAAGDSESPARSDDVMKQDTPEKPSQDDADEPRLKKQKSHSPEPATKNSKIQKEVEIISVEKDVNAELADENGAAISSKEKNAMAEPVEEKNVNAEPAVEKNLNSEPAEGNEAENGSMKNEETAEPTDEKDNTGSKGKEEKAELADKKEAETGSKEKQVKAEPAETKEVTKKEETSTAKIDPSSGFANSSDVSPFGALAGTKSPSSKPQPSSAFAASAFGKLSSSTQSPFGTLGKDTPSKSLFGSPAAGAAQSDSKDTSAIEPSKSPFAAASPSKSGSVFGSLGVGASASPFGGLSKPGASSFATPGASGIVGLSNKPTAPFGAAAADDEDEGSDAEEGEEKEVQIDESKKDKRFFEQDLETGEEDEKVEFNKRAKLYAFIKSDGKKGEWKERGVGQLRLNYTVIDDDDDINYKARFIMRADGSHRVVLNTPVQKEMKIGDAQGNKPENNCVLFHGIVDGKLELLQLKMKQENARALWEQTTELQEQML